MSVVVVDSGGANIASVLHALRRLGAEPEFTADPARVQAATHVVLPGVGAAGRAMDVLRQHHLVEMIRGLRQPVLGICLGMQLLFESSEEGEADLLGIIPARVRRLSGGPGLRIPHMGWNALAAMRADPLSDPLDGAWCYFVHSYAAPVGAWTLATSRHGEEFSGIVRAGNFHGAQFHPERSATAGSRLLQAFLTL